MTSIRDDVSKYIKKKYKAWDLCSARTERDS